MRGCLSYAAALGRGAGTPAGRPRGRRYGSGRTDAAGTGADELALGGGRPGVGEGVLRRGQGRRGHHPRRGLRVPHGLRHPGPPHPHRDGRGPAQPGDGHPRRGAPAGPDPGPRAGRHAGPAEFDRRRRDRQGRRRWRLAGHTPDRAPGALVGLERGGGADRSLQPRLRRRGGPAVRQEEALDVRPDPRAGALRQYRLRPAGLR